MFAGNDRHRVSLGDGQHAVTKSKAELIRQAFLFREGAKRLFEDKSKSTNGDMWFFELYHFLHDVQDTLQEP